jgi:hypothetical protein
LDEPNPPHGYQQNENLQGTKPGQLVGQGVRDLEECEDERQVEEQFQERRLVRGLGLTQRDRAFRRHSPRRIYIAATSGGG